MSGGKTDIKEDLKDCHCLVTNMSLVAVDAILNKGTSYMCGNETLLIQSLVETHLKLTNQ